MRTTTYFDGQLCEHPDDVQALEIEIETQRAELERRRKDFLEQPGEVEQSHVGRAVGRLSYYLQVRGAYSEARELRREAQEIWRQLGREKAMFLAGLHLLLLDAQGQRFAREELMGSLEEVESELQAREGLKVYWPIFMEFKARALAGLGCDEDAKEVLEALNAHYEGISKTNAQKRVQGLLGCLGQ